MRPCRPGMRGIAIAMLALAAVAAAGCGNPTSEVGTAKAGGDPAMPVDVPPEVEGGPLVKGVDVSTYQGTINWAQVKAAGRKFAFIRVSDGTGTIDNTFSTNWSKAKANGIIRGPYQFFRASEDPTAQAELLISKVGVLEPYDIPPTLDVEVMDGQSAATLLARARTWVQVIQSYYGRKPIVYSSPGFWDGLGAASWDARATCWVAHWGVSSPTIPDSWNDWMWWQYSDAGSVSGISGAVDVDEFHGSYEDMMEWVITGQVGPG